MQSWVYGKAIQLFEPGAIALFTSRGYEMPSSKTLMRWSVVISDILGMYAFPLMHKYKDTPRITMSAHSLHLQGWLCLS